MKRSEGQLVLLKTLMEDSKKCQRIKKVAEKKYQEEEFFKHLRIEGSKIFIK